MTAKIDHAQIYKQLVLVAVLVTFAMVAVVLLPARPALAASSGGSVTKYDGSSAGVSCQWFVDGGVLVEVDAPLRLTGVALKR